MAKSLDSDYLPNAAVASVHAQLAYSVAEFCRRYSIGRSTIYTEFKQGRIAFKKVGNRSLILASEAERWAASLPEATK
jgi:excisionase family DNA binding protein